MIPKIIHYCWLSNDEIPSNLINYMKSWKVHLQDYRFIKWTFDNFDKEKSLWVKEAFENKKYAFACDYIRLYAVYNYGGFYLDMDVEVLKSFDSLLNQNIALAYENKNEKGFEAGCFGFEKGHSYLKHCLDYYEGKHFVKADGSFNIKTLPMIMHDVYSKYNYKFNIYNYKIFTCKSFDTGEEFPNENSFTIHHFVGSWLTDKEKQIMNYQNEYSKYFGEKISRVLALLKYEKKTNGIKGIINLIVRKLLKTN